MFLDLVNQDPEVSKTGSRKSRPEKTVSARNSGNRDQKVEKTRFCESVIKKINVAASVPSQYFKEEPSLQNQIKAS